MTLLSAAVLLFFVMDPLGNIPTFLTALKSVPPDRHRAVIVRELLIALAVLVAFLFLGKPFLAMLHISQTALTIGGGVVLLLIALKMVFPVGEGGSEELLSEEPFIVPMAIPYTAGPSAMATVLLLTSRQPERWKEWLAAIVLAWLACSFVLFFASSFSKLLGKRGLVAVERLMGMLLIAVAVEMFLGGLKEYLRQ
jgi:multiple antibiotic resistance protein